MKTDLKVTQIQRVLINKMSAQAKVFGQVFWPAMRARNFVKHLGLKPPGRTISRDKNLEILAKQIRITPEELEGMNPWEFCKRLSYNSHSHASYTANLVMGKEQANQLWYYMTWNNSK